MRENGRVTQPIYSILPSDIDGFDTLAELALDLRWTWNHATDCIWNQLDRNLWDMTHNPWLVLQTVARNDIEKHMADPEFRQKVEQLVEMRRIHLEQSTWFQQTYPKSPLTCVAYFSMEYMLSEALPIYSGGLGNVAGDQLKTYSDLGIPVVGVGLLYQQGYFRQVIDSNGAQQELYPYNDPGQLPISPLRTEDGEWLRFTIALPQSSIWVRTWVVHVGRVRLFLLDSNDAANSPIDRGITSELYGGTSELRLKQEILLGIGGWQLLDALGIQPEVCHLNEGHAAFAILERARSFMSRSSQLFEAALIATRAGNVFTTHTAVSAGFDQFAPDLMARYLGPYAEQKLGLSLDQFMSLGRQNVDHSSEKFNMAYLAVHGSGKINAVSQLHGKVSRNLFSRLFPHWPLGEVPIGHVTNGVHMPTWDSSMADTLWTKTCGKDRWLGTLDHTENDILSIPDPTMWQFRNSKVEALVAFARKRMIRQLTETGTPLRFDDRSKPLLNPSSLTLGFARRFASYKRPNLLLHDPDRLVRILTHAERPVQLILAGKAHPADEEGRNLIKQWIQFIRKPEVGDHVLFLSDYDMSLTEQLVQGVDVWINTPRRPWEACGTSGMKVLVNGGLNLSELDGWWAEAYSPDVGWALGDGKEHENDAEQDEIEALALYDLLENQIVPEFYNRDHRDIPTAWIHRMRESMAKLSPRFSANRSVREYTEQYYLPAAQEVLRRMAQGGELADHLLMWQQEMETHWPKLSFGSLHIESAADGHDFRLQLNHEGLDPDHLLVELFAEGLLGADSDRVIMQKQDLAGNLVSGESSFLASVPANRPSSDYTARVLPYHEDISVPLECQKILWQRS